jgi:type III restriction enzyme
MSNVQLKNYQVNTLESLKTYLTQARMIGAKAAYDAHEKPNVVNRPAYQALPAPQENVPYVCLRLPTGGGKTLLSAHSVRIASETYLERDFPLVLWLVPSNTIRQQTLETLKTAGNPNYETLRTAFDGKFMVLDITDFEQLRPQDISGKAVIVVGTVQTIKTEESNTDSRKVYTHNENLESHFGKIPAGFTGYDKITEGADAGKIRFSFVNLMRMHRPLVLVDEAHNNATKLGFEVFQRINAACVIEFTATPASNSNILHRVSAMELKKEEMIKLPIVLTEHQTWEAAVRDSILTRQRLEALCQNEDRYIRPIVLFQAENQGQENTWQVLKEHLISNENIPENKIAVVTGDQRELDGINLFDPACPIDFIITVQALKEGWDCSFAYVFCSLASIHSAKDVEQILGRVLRMPYAKRRAHEDLNRAYAHVSSTSWPNAVKQLHDRLVDKMGFEEEEVDNSIETREPSLPESKSWDGLYKAPEPVKLRLKDSASIDGFSAEDRQSIKIEEEGGGFIAKVVGVLSAEGQEKLIECVTREDRAVAKVNLRVQQATLQRAIAPVNRGEKFIIPQLCLRIDGELEVPDDGAFLYAGNWQLTGHAELSENEFSLQADGVTFAIDIEDGRVRNYHVTQASQFNLDLVDSGWTVNHLSQWLDKRLRQADIPQPQMLEFIRRTIVWLEGTRNIPLTALARARFILHKVLDSKIRQLRQQAKKAGYQLLLIEPDAKPEVSFENSISFEPNSYFPQRFYRGAFKPQKHFYAEIGEMNSEEIECAKAIEMHPKVKYWVRNLERDPRAFRLPTSSDWFYPDFVAMLDDGRILVIEYKGEHLRNPDTNEKDNIGAVWANKSNGKGLFLIAWKAEKGMNLQQQIAATIGA